MIRESAKALRFASSISGLLAHSRKAKEAAYDEFKPPTMQETRSLLDYLKASGVQAIIIGSSAVIAHLGIPEDRVHEDFRPTKDLDLVVKGKLPGVRADPSVATLPVMDLPSLFRTKLNSIRQSDLLDLVALARRNGIPNGLGKLNRQQRENLDTIRIWTEHAPEGAYGT